MVGYELVKLGFCQLDGLDLAANMLELSKQKQIYTNLHQIALGKSGDPENMKKLDLLPKYDVRLSQI